MSTHKATDPSYRIAIVGPTYPYKSGIALHTTELASHLSEAGHKVHLFSWKAQYPGFLYPGEQKLDQNQAPEIPPFTPTSYDLAWYNPLGWFRLGRRLRSYDQVVIIFFVPQIQGPLGRVIIWALGRSRRPKIIALCHNVLPHESHIGDRLFAKSFLKRVDTVLVHSPDQAALAQELTSKPVRTAAMASYLPYTSRQAAPHRLEVQKNLLFFGIIRHYKGVDILLRALANVPGIRLTIAGESWGKTGVELRELIKSLGLGDRVTYKDGYVPIEELAELFAASDALVLPYRTITGTQNVQLGFAYGVPVIATRIGHNQRIVQEGVDGLLCDPDSVESLTTCLRKFYEPGTAEKLLRHVKPVIDEEVWATYLQTLLKP